ncbi:hypothetical protein BDN71DRAFT_1456296 [Pleurotus eryngii]|uniref:Uncharacterized protein n=1 Tax=Pleurotus eryngii TaxID=5323 RepID=A0A9P5ZL52_PLEER|nr:hypothetical protein BDN71DRAFT_1456296 [Pleurotus eryngii]
MSDGEFNPNNEGFHQVYVTEPCRRCDYKFHYPEGTPWNVVNDMVNNHWSVCPGSISASMARSRHMAAADPRYSGALSVQEGLEGGSSNDENDADTQVRRNRKKNMMDETERKKKLEEDPWAVEVTPVSVRCGACTRLVSLDKRSRYYPGLWLKHREKCMEIKRLEALENEQSDESTSGSPAKKRSKGKEVHHDSDLNNSRSSDLKEKGVQENTEDQTQSPSATEETSESRQGSQHTFEAAESFAESPNRSDDFTSTRLIGKRRRSSSSGRGVPTVGAET